VKAEALAPSFRKMLRDASRLPALESFFASKWPAGARRVLPAENPQLPATALWGPVVAWSILQIMAQAALDSGADASANSAHAALDIFDRLRLREPLAQAFHALGLEGELGWQGAARIKALLLVENERARQSAAAAGPGGREVTAESAGESAARAEAAAEALVSEAASTAPQPASVLSIPPDLWSDTDICWLTGAHVAEGNTYLVREPFEELLWWLELPDLLRLAAAPSPQRADAEAIAQRIHRALTALEQAGYRLDVLLEPELAATPEPEPHSVAAAPASVPRTGKIDQPAPEDLEPQEPVIAKPVGPVNPEGQPEEY
jgi:hypothetical protein